MIGLHHITRRRLLTAMALSPLLWRMNTAHAAAKAIHSALCAGMAAGRAAAGAGITPYGIADIPTTLCGS